MHRIDPHTHSNISDGTDTPAALMEAAAAAGLTVVGLTDHDTTGGWEEAAAQVARTGVSLLRGMEVSCQGEGITVHLLSYLHDPTDPDLLAACAATLESRRTRAQRMVEGGQVDGALAEIIRLPDHSAADKWVMAARRYLAGRGALDQIETAALLDPATSQGAPSPWPQPADGAPPATPPKPAVAPVHPATANATD